jgi:hypothetical protein
VAGRLHVFGGPSRLPFENGDPASQSTWCCCYDETTDRWHAVATEISLLERHSFGLAVVGNNVYIVGGYSFDGDHVSVVERVDTPSGRVERLALVPIMTCCSPVVVLQELVCFFARRFHASNRDRVDVFKYDAVNDQWVDQNCALPSLCQYVAEAVFVPLAL